MKVFVILLVLVGFVALTQQSFAWCMENEDWKDAPCYATAYQNFSKEKIQNDWAPYYDYKGQEWMEQKKLDLMIAIRDGYHEEWHNESDANSNVFQYYYAFYDMDKYQNFYSPHKQLTEGFPFNEIQCKENLILIQKYDGSPACVKPETVSKLVAREWGMSDNWIKISNVNKAINYQIDNAKITSIQAFSEHKNPSLQEEFKQTWLKINLESKQNGSLKIILPRNLIDSKINSLDDDFFVLLDDTETEYQETKTDSERTLDIYLPSEINIVEIIGYGFYNSELNQISSNSSESKIMNDAEMILSITPQKTHYLNNETIHVVGHIDNKSLGYPVGITTVDWKNNIVKQDHVELDHEGNFNLSYTISEFCKSGKYYIILDDYQLGKTKTVYFDVQYTQTKSIYPECKDGELLNCGVCKRIIP